MADNLFGISSNPQLFRHLSDNFHGNNDMDNSFMSNTVSSVRERKPKLTRSGIALSTEQKMQLIGNNIIIPIKICF